MAVKLSPGWSIVVRRASVEKLNARAHVEAGDLGGVFSQDAALIVLGPFFEAASTTAKLTALGFEYFEDYFDITHDGGTVPEWCAISLELRSPGDGAATTSTGVTSS